MSRNMSNPEPPRRSAGNSPQDTSTPDIQDERSAGRPSGGRPRSREENFQALIHALAEAQIERPSDKLEEGQPTPLQERREALSDLVEAQIEIVEGRAGARRPPSAEERYQTRLRDLLDAWDAYDPTAGVKGEPAANKSEDPAASQPEEPTVDPGVIKDAPFPQRVSRMIDGRYAVKVPSRGITVATSDLTQALTINDAEEIILMTRRR